MKSLAEWRVACLSIAGLLAIGSEVGAAKPTFNEDVAVIVHQKCSSCHRPGQSGPFELLTYKDVASRADTIVAVIDDGYMPPWKLISNDVGYAHDRRLSERQQDTIRRWVESGVPEGDPAQKPDPPTFPSDWQLGTPDLVVQMEGEFAVPADGPDIYRSFIFQLALPEDKWVKAVEMKPNAKSALHHALFFLDSSGVARSRDGRDGRAGLSGMSFLQRNRDQQDTTGTGGISDRGLGGYVPGTTPAKLPGDLAMFLPKNSDVVMQTHFHPSGKPETEKATLALYFADKPPSRRLAGIQLPPAFGRFAGIDVPAGESHYEIKDSFTLPVAVEGIAIGGHAHYICREMHFEAQLPDGRELSLLTIDDWDLDWQDSYQFANSVSLPAGTVLNCRIVYDNSADNPENPFHPPQRIKWGRESTDEMGSVTLTVVAKRSTDREALQDALRKHQRGSLFAGIGRSIGRGIADRARRAAGSSAALMRRLDTNGDGQLDSSEVPQRLRGIAFGRLDANGDGKINQKELAATAKKWGMAQ
ncbi:MAG: hypothetical protein AAGA03_05120 [Planctomycetota bacterium]